MVKSVLPIRVVHKDAMNDISSQVWLSSVSFCSCPTLLLKNPARVYY